MKDIGLDDIVEAAENAKREIIIAASSVLGSIQTDPAVKNDASRHLMEALTCMECIYNIAEEIRKDWPEME